MFDFEKPNIEIVYRLQTSQEEIEIHHKGAFINKTKTRAIKEYAEDLIKAEKCEEGYCFPNRLSDITVLDFAIKNLDNSVVF